MRLLISFMLLLCSIAMAANPIDERQAQTIASQFMRRKGYSSVKSRQARIVKLNDGTTRSSNTPSYYIFNVDSGFVIVSGSDLTPNILGYNMSENFDVNNVPANLKSWLSFYASEIDYIEKNNIKTSRISSNLRKEIKPLLNCKWAQGYPYNLMCPTYNDKHCVTGCVATALAQVMYYHKWPEKTLQEIPGYNLSINGVSTDISSIPAGTEFNWNLMQSSYSNYGNPTEKEYAVAKLMAAAGTAMHMSYNTGTSSAYYENYPKALKNYFGYSDNVQLVYREDFENWENLIYQELVASRPVLYCGQSAYNGHAFVVDGYDGDQLFHVDWGWGGPQGYYLLDILNPDDKRGVYAESSEESYSSEQYAVINIVPSGQEADSHYEYDINNNVVSQDFRCDGKLVANTPQKIQVTLTNLGETAYGYTGLCFVAVNHHMIIPYWTKSFTLKKKESQTFSWSWVPEFIDNYKIFLHVNGKDIDSVFVDVNSIKDKKDKELTLVSAILDAEDNNTYKTCPFNPNATIVDVTDRSTTAKISICNTGKNKYRGEIQFNLCKVDTLTGASQIIRTYSYNVWGDSGYTWNFYLNLVNIPLGIYRLDIYANDELIDDKLYYQFVQTVKAWTGPNKYVYVRPCDNTVILPGEATYVDIRDISGMKIEASKNPNTLYVIGNSQQIPSSLKDKNIIISNNDNYGANKISLTDGYPYYSPVDYTAKDITFVKTFYEGNVNGKYKWATICLPFSPSVITSKGVAYDWCHGTDDSYGNFYLQRITRIENQEICFECVNNQFNAWEPYLVGVPQNLKQMEFHAQNATISSIPSKMPRTDSFRFVSNFQKETLYDVYVCEDTRFSYKETLKTTPFNCYLLPTKSLTEYPNIQITTESGMIIEPNLPKCDAPIISYKDGRLIFNCNTPNATYNYIIKDEDVGTEQKTTEKYVLLSGKYNISAYTTAEGYKPSDAVTGVLYWLEGDLQTDNISMVKTRGVVAFCHNGFISISGLDNNELVSFCTIDGKVLGSQKAIDGAVSYAIDNNTKIVIAKIGDSCIKIINK